MTQQYAQKSKTLCPLGKRLESVLHRSEKRLAHFVAEMALKRDRRFGLGKTLLIDAYRGQKAKRLALFPNDINDLRKQQDALALLVSMNSVSYIRTRMHAYGLDNSNQTANASCLSSTVLS